MAKFRSNYLGKARGRANGLVYSIVKGQQVVKGLPESVTNPRTTAQMLQRTKLANMVQAYKHNRFWMRNGAFESKKDTWSDYNAFVSANQSVDVYLTKDMVSAGYSIVAPYAVTKGSLPSVLCSWDDDIIASDIFIGSQTITNTTTVGQLSQAILDNNGQLYEGDQISVVINYQQGNTDAPSVLVRAYEFVINPTDERTLADLGLFTEDSGFTPSQVYGDNNNSSLGWATGDPQATVGGTFIISRSTGGKILVSSENIVLNNMANDYLAYFQSTEAKNRAIASYGEQTENFLASGYSSAASNIAVLLRNSILSVNSVPVGGTLRLASGPSGANNAILMAEQPTAVTSVRFELVEGTSFTVVSNITVSGNTIIAPHTTSQVPEGTNPQVARVIAAIDGQTYIANFNTSSGGEIQE